MKISRSPSNSKLRNKDIMIEAPMPFVLSLNKTKTKRANAVKLRVRSSPLTNSTNAAGEGVNMIVGIPIPTAYAAQSAVESPEYSANNTVFLFTGCERSNSINSDELKKYIVANRILMIGTNSSVMFNRLNNPFDELLSILNTLKDITPNKSV